MIAAMDSTFSFPLISVIVPVKNGERFLAQALESILAQTVQPDEILVVVAESGDKSLEIAHSFAQVTVLAQEDEGLANARNLGIAASRGDLIAFLDHDDVWPVGKLEQQQKFLADQPELQYTIGYVAFLGGNKHDGRSNPGPADRSGRLIGATPGCLMAAGNLWASDWQANVLKAHGYATVMSWKYLSGALKIKISGFDPAYQIGCDHDWFSRARDQGVATAVIPEILLYKRLHETNLSRNIRVYQQEMLHVMRESIHRKQLQPTGKNVSEPSPPISSSRI